MIFVPVNLSLNDNLLSQSIRLEMKAALKLDPKKRRQKRSRGFSFSPSSINCRVRRFLKARNCWGANQSWAGKQAQDAPGDSRVLGTVCCPGRPTALTRRLGPVILPEDILTPTGEGEQTGKSTSQLGTT